MSRAAPRSCLSVFYNNVTHGDDCQHGNCEHPSIIWPGFADSDFEEDGERVWDAMRAVDYLLTLPAVDPKRIVVTGLSLGGEITTWTAALDARLAAAMPAGYSPDTDVMYYHGNHPCWLWRWSNVREYIDTSSLHGLIAPRPMVVMTGRQDRTYSSRDPPFSADKQVARRSRAVYGAQAE